MRYTASSEGRLQRRGSSPDLVANIASCAVWAFGIVVAVNQIGVAETLVNTLFMGFIAALALALGLAFGLGSRDTAGEIVRAWYQKAKDSKPQLERAANVAQHEARETSRDYTDETRRPESGRRPLAPGDAERNPYRR